MVTVDSLEANRLAQVHRTCRDVRRAGEIERVVVDEVRSLVKDEALLTHVLSEAHATNDADLAAARREPIRHSRVVVLPGEARGTPRG